MRIDEAFKRLQDVVLAEQVRTMNREARNPRDAAEVMALHNALWTIKQQLNFEEPEGHEQAEF